MTTEDLLKMVVLGARSAVQDNFIEKVTSEDTKMAVNMTVSYINTYKPITNYTIYDLIGDNDASPWVSVLVHGSIYHLIMNQVSEWMHNGMDVSIDELSVSDKMEAYKEIAEAHKETFEQLLQNVKSQFYITKARALVKKVTSNMYSSGTSSRFCSQLKTFRYKH